VSIFRLNVYSAIGLLLMMLASVAVAHGTLTVDGEPVPFETMVVNITTVPDVPPPSNEPPVANAGGPYSGTVGSPVRFDGSASSDPDGIVTKYGWIFGDGSGGSGVSPSHTYTTAGTFTVGLEVMDNDGATDMDSSAAVVSPTGPPPGECGPIPPNGVGQLYVDLFHTPFPGPKNGQQVVSIPRGVGGYRALGFYTDDRNDSGAFRNIEAAAVPYWRQIAISRCMGDFDVEPACTVDVGTTQDQVLWSTQPWADPRYCYLDKNTKYFWNTRFKEPCTTTYCNTVLRVSNFDYDPDYR
jgi:hypothetical protein